MKPKRIGIAIALLGNWIFGWGLYHVMGIGSCGGEYPPCPTSGWPYFVSVPLGMIVSMVGIFAGGGAFAFVSLFATVGIASILRGLTGGVGPEGDTTFPIVFGGIFLAPLLLPLVLAPFGRRKAREAQRLLSEGRTAIGTVTGVHDTGVTINDNPRVHVTLSIQPEDGSAAFGGTKTMTVSRVQIPRPGDRYPIWYDPADPKKFGIGTGLDASAAPEVRALFERAGRAGPAPGSPVAPAAPAAPAAATDMVSELTRLNDLRMSGALTDEEFNRAKDRLLGGSAAT